MARCYIIAYDIRDPRRLRRVHEVMVGYGEPWQYSLFFCVLRDADRVRMERALATEMDLKVDQALVVDLGGNEEAARKTARVLGSCLPPQQPKTLVI